MQIVKLQCPACGAAITAPQTGREFACSYCGTRLAVIRHDGETNLVESEPRTKTKTPVPVVDSAAADSLTGSEPETMTPTLMMPLATVDFAVPESPPANGRGCVAALIMWLVGGPLVVFLLMLPIVMVAPTDAEGQVMVPDAVSVCVGLGFVAIPLLLAVYAFVYFRRRENSVWGYFTTPFRLFRRRK